MKVARTVIGLIVIAFLLAILWFLITPPTTMECKTDEDCIPEEPLIGVTYYCDEGVCKTKPFGNPASMYCEEQGGTVDIRTNPNGSQYGVCVFSDSSECEEWAYFGGECQPGIYFPNRLSCQKNEDCVPVQCCHPDTCININYRPNCEGIFCTMECRPGTMDCGQGYCACIDETCQVVWTS